jgi:hypothetical protein
MSCLQSEMMRPHMPVHPASYSLRHIFMHLRKSQLASTPRAELTVMKSAPAKAKKQT